MGRKNSSTSRKISQRTQSFDPALYPFAKMRPGHYSALATNRALELKRTDPKAYRTFPKKLRDATAEAEKFIISMANAMPEIVVPPEFQKLMPKLRELVAADPELRNYTYSQFFESRRLVELARIPKKSGRKQSLVVQERIRLFVEMDLKGITQRKMAPVLFPALTPERAYNETRALKCRHRLAIEAAKKTIKSKW
jgi:hypothetical protein